jgi:hypothetical protein
MMAFSVVGSTPRYPTPGLGDAPGGHVAPLHSVAYRVGGPLLGSAQRREIIDDYVVVRYSGDPAIESCPRYFRKALLCRAFRRSDPHRT